MSLNSFKAVGSVPKNISSLRLCVSENQGDRSRDSLVERSWTCPPDSQSLCVQQNKKRLNIIWNFQKYFVSLHKNIYSLMEEDQKKHLEEELHGHIVSEPQEGVFAYSRADVYEDEPRYDFEGKDFDLPITSDEVKAELKEADRELNKPEMWTSLSCFISDFKQSHSSWLK